jgi:hypothetical protein
MVNGNSIAYYMTMWHSVADIAILTSEEVRAQILEPCLQDRLIALRPANFNLGNANINTLLLSWNPFMQRS